MNYYLIFQEHALHIVSVTPEQEVGFRQQYAACILAFGGSLGEVLQKFHELPLIFRNGV